MYTYIYIYTHTRIFDIMLIALIARVMTAVRLGSSISSRYGCSWQQRSRRVLHTPNLPTNIIPTNIA